MAGLFCILCLTGSCMKAQDMSDEFFIRDCLVMIQPLPAVQQKALGIHPFLGRRHPIAVVKDDQYYLFDPDSAGQGWHYSYKRSVPFPLPPGVQASFPIDGRATCVVTRQVFDKPDGHIIILHEFMHCTQYDICERPLKKSLQLGRSSDPAWEIMHPFPYDDPVFTAQYDTMLTALDSNDRPRIRACRMKLRQHLNPVDYEFMVWQEWKEGFARLIENRLRNTFGLADNAYGSEKPYHRITFYAGGEKLIGSLVRDNPDLFCDIESLFHVMMRPGDGP